MCFAICSTVHVTKKVDLILDIHLCLVITVNQQEMSKEGDIKVTKMQVLSLLKKATSNCAAIALNVDASQSIKAKKREETKED